MHVYSAWKSLTWLVMAVGVLCAGCRKQEPAGQPSVNQTSGEVRIITLSPAISRTLVDFGLADKVIGRTPHCASLSETIPAVGDLLNMNYEQLVRLQPTHILVQPPEGGVDAHLQSLAKEHGWIIAAWRLNSLDDIETMIRELPGVLFADGSQELEHTTQKSSELLNAMATALSPGEKPLYRGRVMLLYSVDPVSVFGVGTYLDGVLRALGGANATEAQNWVTFSLEDVTRINPQAVIVVKPGSQNINVQYALGDVWNLDIDAVTERRLSILTNVDAFLPSTSVIGVAAELRQILEQFEGKAQ